MRLINSIIVHCADNYADMDIGVKEIDVWHKNRKFDKIGYHYVIRRDGTVEKGRKLNEVGAHAYGFNAHSIGICYAGGLSEDAEPEDNRTPEQKQSMIDLIKSLLKVFPSINTICGHRDLKGVTKACPCFDATAEYKHLL